MYNYAPKRGQSLGLTTNASRLRDLPTGSIPSVHSAAIKAGWWQALFGRCILRAARSGTLQTPLSTPSSQNVGKFAHSCHWWQRRYQKVGLTARPYPSTTTAIVLRGVQQTQLWPDLEACQDSWDSSWQRVDPNQWTGQHSDCVIVSCSESSSARRVYELSRRL